MPPFKPQSIVAPQEKMKRKGHQCFNTTHIVLLLLTPPHDTDTHTHRAVTLLFSGVCIYTACLQQRLYAESRGRSGPRALKIKCF